MTAVWIAFGAMAISMVTVFISLNAAKEAKRKKEGGDGGHPASDTDRDRSDPDWGDDGGGDGGGGD